MINIDCVLVLKKKYKDNIFVHITQYGNIYTNIIKGYDLRKIKSANICI